MEQRYKVIELLNPDNISMVGSLEECNLYCDSSNKIMEADGAKEKIFSVVPIS